MLCVCFGCLASCFVILSLGVKQRLRVFFVVLLLKRLDIVNLLLPKYCKYFSDRRDNPSERVGRKGNQHYWHFFLPNGQQQRQQSHRAKFAFSAGPGHCSVVSLHAALAENLLLVSKEAKASQLQWLAQCPHTPWGSLCSVLQITSPIPDCAALLICSIQYFCKLHLKSKSLWLRQPSTKLSVEDNTNAILSPSKKRKKRAIWGNTDSVLLKECEFC